MSEEIDLISNLQISPVNQNNEDDKVQSNLTFHSIRNLLKYPF